MLTTRIEKWSDGYGVRIPKAVIDQMGMTEGAQFIVQLGKDGILLIPIDTEGTLEELLAQIAPENIHGEADFGKAVGKEVW